MLVSDTDLIIVVISATAIVSFSCHNFGFEEKRSVDIVDQG